jgi:glycosyltransferase involved in cell wall biosynthesis
MTTRFAIVPFLPKSYHGDGTPELHHNERHTACTSAQPLQPFFLPTSSPHHSVTARESVQLPVTISSLLPAEEYHKQVPKYSIVVPFHNEEENVTTLYDRLKAVMEQVGETFELVFVDDGSRDRTYRLLEEIAAVDSRVLVIKLRRNFGQTSALAAGFDHAQGDCILAMDGDLQHSPDEIPNFLAKLEEGYDVVSGWRSQRGDNFILRRIPSRCANWLMACLSGVNIHDFGTTFKAYRREVIQNIPLYGEMHRFIPALASWYGASICEIPISNPAREFGKSHYGISRTFRVFFDLLTIRFLLRYMTRPLHFFGTIGALGMLAGSGLATWLLILKLITGQHVMDIHGPIFVIAGILILAGIQMMGIGLLGELQVRHFHTASHRAPYAVDRILRLRSEESLLQ